MPLVSIITPTQAHNAQHILAVHRALENQVMPRGWEWEWLVQEDGPSPSVGEVLPADERVRYDALGLQIGSAATRNHALARAHGDVVAGMDHDDYHLPGGLAALLAPLEQMADVMWSCGSSRLLMEDGGTWTKPPVFPVGRVPARAVTDHFLATDDFPFPAAFTAYRRVPLVAHGGWPAVARSTDAVLLADFGDANDGWWVDGLIAVYRRWPQQRTVQPTDIAIRDLPHVRGIIGQHRDARDAMAAQPPSVATPRAGSAHHWLQEPT